MDESLLDTLVNSDLVREDLESEPEPEEEEEEELSAEEEEESSAEEEEEQDEYGEFVEQTRDRSQRVQEQFSEFKSVHQKRQEEIEKSQLLAKSKTLTEKGIEPGRALSVNDSLATIRFEVFAQLQRWQEEKALVWMKRALVSSCTALEMANGYFDPFGVDIKGYSTSIDMEMQAGDYDDSLIELRTKYMGKTKVLPPELKIGFLLASTALTQHLQNSTQNKHLGAVVGAGLKAVTNQSSMNPPDDSDEDE